MLIKNKILQIYIYTIVLCIPSVILSNTKDRLEIYNISWDVVTRIPIRPEELVSHIDVKTISNYNQSEIDSVLHFVQQLKSKNIIVKRKIDTRICCYIIKDSIVRDTLAFGNNGVLYYNGKTYQLEKDLLLLIASNLSKLEMHKIYKSILHTKKQ